MTVYDKIRQVLACYRKYTERSVDDPNGYFAGIVAGIDSVAEFLDDIEAGKL